MSTQHWMPSRTQRALDALKDGTMRVIMLDEDMFLVQSGDSWYHVSLENSWCECMDFRVRGTICKHIRASVLAEARGEHLAI